MEWLFIFGLGFWAWLMWNRIDVLTKRVDELTRALNQAAPAQAAPAPRTTAPPPAPVEAPLVLTRVVPPEPLLLDTPLPPASNDEDDALEPMPELPRVLREQRRADGSFEKWLSENGLAWLGGGALALGGAFLVAFAAQSGFFTPLMRLGAAVILGALMIGASEWVRQGGARMKAFEHPLAAALLAGAGAATIYASAWAAHGLYNYIDGTFAAILLTLCAALLLALSMVHGQALGVLAILAALAAPPLSGAGQWPSAALTLYICAVAAAGFAVSAVRRWIWAAAATVAGLYAWFAAAIAADEIIRALALLSFASIGGVAVALRRPKDDAEDSEDWRQASAVLPAIALCVSSVLLLWTWLSLSAAAEPHLAASMIVGLMHVALAAGAVRARAVHPAAFAVSVGAFAFGAIGFLRARETFGPLGGDFYVWALAAAPVIAIAALGARADRRNRTLVAAAGAIGASVMVVLAAFSRDPWNDPTVWAPLLTAAALLGVPANVAARQVQDATRDWSVDFWAVASGILALIGLESLVPSEWMATAVAAMAAAFAFLYAREGWRAFAFASLVAAVLAIGHALSGDVTGAALVGATPLWRTLTILGAGAAFLFGAAYLATPRGRDTGEALSSAGILMSLLAVFHALRWVAAGGIGTPLDPFTEASLNTLTIIAGGYLALPRSPRAGIIAKARGHVLMGAGLLYTLIHAGLTANPWWGVTPAEIIGPPLVNTHLFAFAAPAALAIAAAARLYGKQRFAGRAYAILGAVLAIVWALVEIRRLFHGPTSPSADVGAFEGQCYGLVFLNLALAVAWIAKKRDAVDPTRPFTHDLHRVSRGVAVGGVVIAALIMLIGRHPWWGGQIGAASGDLGAALATLAQAGAVVMSLYLGRALSRSDGVERTRFVAAASAAVFGWSFGHCAIRWLVHGGAMDDGVAFAGLEGFAHALWPLAFVLGAAQLTERAPGRDTVRAYLHDLSALWATAVWPALAWTAFALWFLFNPWWGAAPAYAPTALDAVAGLAALLSAAWLSFSAPSVAHVRNAKWFGDAARVTLVGHLFVALSLAIRRLYQGGDMRSALEAGSLETWTYSALWAVFGAGVLGYGAVRKDPALRWSGLAVLLFVTGKVFLFDMSQLEGVVRAASFLGLGAVLVFAALAARRFSAPARD